VLLAVDLSNITLTGFQERGTHIGGMKIIVLERVLTATHITKKNIRFYILYIKQKHIEKDG